MGSGLRAGALLSVLAGILLVITSFMAWTTYSNPGTSTGAVTFIELFTPSKQLSAFDRPIAGNLSYGIPVVMAGLVAIVVGVAVLAGLRVGPYVRRVPLWAGVIAAGIAILFYQRELRETVEFGYILESFGSVLAVAAGVLLSRQEHALQHPSR